jgi:hypothetical protein
LEANGKQKLTRVKILHVEKSGELRTNTHGRAERMICSPKHKFSPLLMRSLLAAKEKGAAENRGTETFCQGYNRSLPDVDAAERRAAAWA